jgi:hypothetical protein
MWSEHFQIADLVYEGLLRFSAAFFFKLGWNVLVVNPSDVKRGDKERYQKTDALDSKKLVQSIKIRCSKRCFYSTEEHEQFTWLAIERK